MQAQQVKDCFAQHWRRYGSQRIAKQLKLGRFLVRRLMREPQLRAIPLRRFAPRTTNSQHGAGISPDLLNAAGGTVSTKGQVLVGNITYLLLRSGKFCYLATFQDNYTRRIVGWRVAADRTAELVTRALAMALRRGLLEKHAIVHTDRSSQYVSHLDRELLHLHRLRQSMSGKGNCYDNAQAESFFARLKTELVEDGIFASTAQAETETFSSIEG
ncbi:MAG: IS3 family transposase [Blastocatellia bacterium]